MDTSVLEELGFTNAEIKVYLALLELGSSTAGPVIEKTGLQNSVVHMTLHKLVEKGFVSFVKKGKVRHYQAADPRNIIRFIEEKRERYEKLLPELLVRQKKQEKQEAEIFEGFKGFKTMQYEAVRDAKPGDEYLFFSFKTKNPKDFAYVYKFYQDFEKYRRRRGIVVRGIISPDPDILEMLKGRDPRGLLVVDIPTPQNVSVINDKVLMTPWEEKKISFLIHSRQLAETFRTYFYSIWDKYKK
ncbi:MAG: BlaI/MecI/CopY family transcriptional regulator [Nanoarchaeota archaeon]|nr:BlaI/MecI/CopY family transcriptional regulator [Nanoarchaeota archaeon]